MFLELGSEFSAGVRNGFRGKAGGSSWIHDAHLVEVRRRLPFEPDCLSPRRVARKRRSSVHHLGPARLPSGLHNLVPHLSDLPVLAADRVGVNVGSRAHRRVAHALGDGREARALFE